VVVLMLVDGSIFACLIFSFLYLWTVTLSGFPPGSLDMPPIGSSVAAVISWIVVAGSLFAANRVLAVSQRRMVSIALLGALVATWLALGGSLYALLGTNLRPQLHGYASTAYTMVAWQGLHAVLMALMVGFTVARLSLGIIDSVRRNVFDNTSIMGYDCAGHGLIALLVMHAPRLGMG
jgi:cytochrome c oxidase subunit I+III